MDNLEEFIKEFISESDRAAVVLGAAKLDDMLLRILERYMLPSTTTKDELLSTRMPLNAFGAKIDLVYRLGLIREDFRDALHAIRKIRNSFAHNVEGCSLQDQKNKDLINNLAKPYKGRLFFEKSLESYFGNEHTESTYFRTVLSIHAYRLFTLSTVVKELTSENAWEMLIPNWEYFEDESSK